MGVPAPSLHRESTDSLIMGLFLEHTVAQYSSIIKARVWKAQSHGPVKRNVTGDEPVCDGG